MSYLYLNVFICVHPNKQASYVFLTSYMATHRRKYITFSLTPKEKKNVMLRKQ
jgi:hypothetical protein